MIIAIRSLTFALALVVSPLVAAEPSEPANIKRYVAVENVCAWPQLTVLPDGTIAAIIHNQPAHGLLEGDVECWTSSDGEFWHKAGTPTQHEPNTIRMNHASGLAKNGDLLVLCSGWTNVKQPERPKQERFRDAVISTWICRSSDGGRTWTQSKEFAAAEKGWTEFVPFGPIFVGDDGALHASCYAGEFTDATQSYKTKSYRSWHFRSDDDGKTWRPTSVIGTRHNETSLFYLGGKRWLAAARIDAMNLFRSDDDGATWQGGERITEPGELNAHLARLKDGRLLLSYGNRVKGKFGVMAKLSADEGKTWGEPMRLARTLNFDCGYPSSVQRSDGRIVTAYYAKGAPEHDGYHMGLAIWAPPAR